MYTEYYCGHLAYDREGNKDLDKLANKYWTLYERGEVTLAQRRVAPKTWSYGYEPRPKPVVG